LALIWSEILSRFRYLLWDNNDTLW
jgi:hypothetical protein